MVQDQASESLIFEITHRSNSMWTKKGTEHDKNPQHLNCAKTHIVDMRSQWFDGKGMQDIQYIPGAPTIFVNDYVDEKGKMQKGLRSLQYNLQEGYRMAVEKNIVFSGGLLYLDVYGGQHDPVLVEFMKHHGSNTGAPGYKRNPRRNNMFLFAPLVKEKEAQKSLDTIEIELEAQQIFTELRSDKNGKFTYNKLKIDALCAIFEVGGGLGGNESSQKMLAIQPWVKANPVKFVEDCKETLEYYKLEIGKAVSYKLLELKENSAILNIVEAQPVTVSLKEATDEITEALAYHFIGNDAGKITFEQMQGEIERKRIELLK